MTPSWGKCDWCSEEMTIYEPVNAWFGYDMEDIDLVEVKLMYMTHLGNCSEALSEGSADDCAWMTIPAVKLES